MMTMISKVLLDYASKISDEGIKGRAIKLAEAFLGIQVDEVDLGKDDGALDRDGIPVRVIKAVEAGTRALMMAAEAGEGEDE